jgi:hypothetical protein
MMSFHPGDLRVQCCGLLMDPGGRANFGHPLETGSLLIALSLKSKYGKCRD